MPVPKRPVDLIFGGRREAIANNQCMPSPLGCGKSVVNEKGQTLFRNDLSRQEYQISGLCQKCQDKIFGSDK